MLQPSNLLCRFGNGDHRGEFTTVREIVKNIRMHVDGKEMDFRLTKLDAFSGVFLLRHLMKLPEGSGAAPVSDMLFSMPEDDLRSVMVSCLNHAEVLLPAGYQPVMQGSSWSWPELEHDAATCLKLVIKEIAWTLSGFFSGGGSPSKAAAPDT